jgi:pimeloyl-ACP methyl ester carboxylesterase
MVEATMIKGYVTIPDGQMHYRSEGTGEPLLLFHMAPMSSLEFESLIPLLAGKYRVIAPDMLGHGESSDPPHDYTIREFGEAAVKFMDALGIKKAHIAGNHTGSIVALYVAAEHPERVNKLIVSGENLTSREKILETIELLKKMPMSRNLPMDEEGKFLQGAWANYKPLMAPGAPLTLRFKPFILGLTARLRKYDVHMAAYNGMLENRLPRVKQPLLIFSGDRDLFFKKEEMDAASGKFKCKTAVIEGAGAMIMWEKPEEVAKVFLDFLGK